MGIYELMIVVLIFVILVVSVLAIVLGLRRKGRSIVPTDAPSGQQPPPGYWWDGEKWNPPGSA